MLSRDGRGWRLPLLWLAALGVVVAALLPFRERIDAVHVCLGLLLLVVGAAAHGGRIAGLLVAGAGFLSFNWFFLPPYGTFRLADPRDWLVLMAFFVVGVVTSQLLHRAQAEAAEARARAVEVELLAELGERAMAARRAADALHEVAMAVHRQLHVAVCRIHVRDVGDGPVEAPGATPASAEPITLVRDREAPVAVLADGPLRVLPATGEVQRWLRDIEPPTRLLLPLRRGTVVTGVLDLDDAGGIVLDQDRQRVLDALIYYAASAAERLRLERADERLTAMQETDRARHAVLASVSHDLRTPLTTIKALAGQLRALGDERSEIIEQEADRLNRMVSEILDASRLAMGSVHMQTAVVPVEELVVAALQQVDGSNGNSAIDVSLPSDDPLPLARMDLTQTVRIVVNLLENARKYSPPHAPVELRVERVNESIVVTVLDRGPGVDAREADRIFEPLYRPAGAKPDVGSAGLGLAIARGLARAQGGDVTWRPREGGGSCFVLTLPAASLTDLDA